MKATFSKKLVLNKETISALDELELLGLKGGTLIPYSLARLLCGTNTCDPTNQTHDPNVLCRAC